MNCQSIQKFTYTYLDGEFEERESAEFESHLSVCPACRDTVKQDAMFRESVRKNLHDATDMPEGLSGRVQQRLAQAHREASRSRRLQVPLALAASLALAVVSWQALKGQQGQAPTDEVTVAQSAAQPATIEPVVATPTVAPRKESVTARNATNEPNTEPLVVVAAPTMEPTLQPPTLPVQAPPEAEVDSSAAIRLVSDERPEAEVLDGGIDEQFLLQRSRFGAVRSAANLRAMVRSHVHPIPAEIDGSASVVQAYLAKRVPGVGAPPIGEGVGVRLAGARLTQIGGQPVVRYDYRAYGKPLTAFRFISQRPRDPFLDPEVVESSPGQPDERNEGVVLDRLAGYALLHSMRDGELVSIVTDLDGPQLLHLLRTPTYF